MKYSTLYLAITSALTVTACGGGSSSNPDPDTVKQLVNYSSFSSTETASAAGITTPEGMETTLCYDLNANDLCDSDEPRGNIRGISGSVTLQTSADTNLSNVNILATGSGYKFRLPAITGGSARSSSASDIPDANINPLTNLAYSLLTGGGPVNSPEELAGIIGGSAADYSADEKTERRDHDSQLVNDILLSLGYGRILDGRLKPDTSIQDLNNIISNLRNKVKNRCSTLSDSELIRKITTEGVNSLNDLHKCPAPPAELNFSYITSGSSVDFTVYLGPFSEDDNPTFKWDFGDGCFSSEKNPSHVYTSNGSFTVTLTVCSAVECLTKALSVNIGINNPPIAEFSYKLDGQTAVFVNSSRDPDGDGLTYKWDFGDGSESTETNPAHTYEAGGSYNIKLTVCDGSACSEKSVSVIVGGNNPPIAEFSYKLDGKTAVFTNSSSDPDGDALTYQWDFGDGSESTEPNPAHTYEAGGSYNVKLTVCDGSACSEKSVSVIIGINNPPIAEFSYKLDGKTAVFTNSSSDPDGDALTYKWDFGDGSESTETNPAHTYESGASGGRYNVKLTVCDGSACSEKSVSLNRDVNNPPQADLQFKVTDKTVSFTDKSVDPDGDALTYKWEFGDGDISTDRNPEHRYSEYGSYNVRLTVSDGWLTSEKTVSLVIIEPNPDKCPAENPYCKGESDITCEKNCTTTQKEVCNETGDLKGAITDAYHATNPDGKVGVNKTITSMSDWTSDMLIARSAANDDPRAYRDYHEKPTDIYAVYSAWDDTNLYLMAELPMIAVNENPATGGDFDYSNDQFLPMGIAINTGKRKAGDGSMDDTNPGGVPWNKGEKVFSFTQGIDTLVMYHPRKGLGEPAIFLTNEEGLFSYDDKYKTGFDEAGIIRSGGIEGQVSSSFMGIADNGGSKGDAWKTGTYTELTPTNCHLYQVTIPLTALGIDKNWIEDHGIGVMVFSTFGTSIMDAVPWDPVLVDKATEPYGPDTSTSHEKEDVDVITVPLASVGKLQTSGTATPSSLQCHIEETQICTPVEGCTEDTPIDLDLDYVTDEDDTKVSVRVTVSTGYNDVKYKWKASSEQLRTTEYNETEQTFVINKAMKAQIFSLEVTAVSPSGLRQGSKTVTVNVAPCQGDKCGIIPEPNDWIKSTGNFTEIHTPDKNCIAPDNSVILKYDGFSNPYVWMWKDKSNFTGEVWPGAAMSKVEGCKESFYAYSTGTGVDDASVIFSDNGQNQYPGRNDPGLSYSKAKNCYDYAKGSFVSVEDCGMTPDIIKTATFAEINGSRISDGGIIDIVEKDDNPESGYRDVAFIISGEGVGKETTGTFSIDGKEYPFTNGEIFRIGENITAPDTEAGEAPAEKQLVISHGDVQSTYTIRKRKYVRPNNDVKFSWNNTLIYFVMTDRFQNGDTSNDGSYGRPKKDAAGHGTATFHGGDIKGMTERLDYLKSLGMNAIWISAPYEQSHGWTGGGSEPGVFQHYAYHGYYAIDFTSIDANMGTVDEFRTFVTEAHKRGIRVVLDVVMNHSGYATLKDMCDFGYGVRSDGKNACEPWIPGDGQGFYAKPIDEKQNSAWDNWWGSSWIIFGGYGDPCGPGDGLDACISYLPDFKNSNPHSPTVGVPVFLSQKWSKDDVAHDIPTAKTYRSGNMSVAEFQAHWLASWVEEFGIDGFRCDTAKHVTQSTWKLLKEYSTEALTKWRQNHVNGDDPAAAWTDDFWMTGEHWGYEIKPGESVDKLGYAANGDFDSMINFAFNPDKGSGCRIPSLGDWDTYAGRYGSGSGSPKPMALSYVSSHDTSLCRPGDMKQLGTMLILMPGGVQVFYGDETGRPNDNGGSGNDSEHGTRSDMNFPADIGNQAEWAANADTLSTAFSSNETLAHWQKVGQFRSRNPAVGAGSQTKTADGSLCRKYTNEKEGIENNAVVIHLGAASTVNTGDCFDEGETVVDAYSGNSGTVSGGSVSIPGTGNVILIEADHR